MNQICIVILFPFLATGIALNQRVTESGVGETFLPVLERFEVEASILLEPERDKPRCCNPKQVNAVLQQTKTNILEKVPEDDIPLRRYLEQSMPAPLDESAASAPKQSVESLIAKVKALLGTLTRMQAYRLDLTINTTPRRAHFELVISGASRLTAIRETTVPSFP